MKEFTGVTCIGKRAEEVGALDAFGADAFLGPAAFINGVVRLHGRDHLVGS